MKPYHGPVAVVTPADARRIFEALMNADDEPAKQVLAKCRAVLIADPSWRRPLQ